MLFETIPHTGLATGSAPNAVRALIARINAELEVVSDKNYLYIRNDGSLYYDRIEKEEFIRDFITLYTRAGRIDWMPKHGKQAWETIMSQHYNNTIDNYPHLIAFANGVYNTVLHSFSTDTTDLFIVNRFNFDYTETPSCPLFQTAIEEIIPDIADREWFLTFMCYAFGGHIDQQIAMILMGGGNNGKTKLMEFFIRIMGNKATVAKLHKLKDESYRCNLKGRTLCYSSEIGGRYLDQDHTENIKELITETFFSGRKPYMQLEEWENTTHFVAATNNLPKLQVFERSFLRRFKIIDFPTDFTGREDRTLFERLYKEEGGHVLSWILQNFNNTDILTVNWEDTDCIWRYNSNAVQRFVEEECIEFAGSFTLTNLVYERYVAYVSAESEAPLSQAYFNRQMTKLGHPPIQRGTGWVYRAIQLRTVTGAPSV